MKILLAVDGSKFSKKAVAYILANDNLLGDDGEVVVLNVQPQVPNRVSRLLGANVVKQYHADEAAKVLKPITQILDRHKVSYTVVTKIGHPGDEIVAVSNKVKAHMIVMGTHGHGVLGRALMGSVAQSVLGHCTIPVLMVK